MDIKNEVLTRAYIMLIGIVSVAFVLVYVTLDTAVINAKQWRDKGQDHYVKIRNVAGQRGNITDDDGNLLATSIPFFDIYFDPNTSGLSEEDFMLHVDSLSVCLAEKVDNTMTPGAWREMLVHQRESGARYMLIKRKVSYNERFDMEKFPIFRRGRFGGGFIAERSADRRKPFGILARRTIGYIREGAKPVGLEGAFNEQLSGEASKQWMIRVDKDKDLWMPLQDLTSIEPKRGKDVVTTIDVNLQDITETALMRAMQHHNAEWGTAVLMEVETGAIKAIANLEGTESGFYETYNYAVGAAVEPGSTFKLASMMALLEGKYVNLQDTISINKGEREFYDAKMVDSSPLSFKIDSTSVAQAFGMSSNVGIATMVNDHFGRKTSANDQLAAKAFIDQLKAFNLHLPTDIEIEGEGKPYIKEAYSEEMEWSGITLPWMSTGYELRLTPLQLLSFYNAIANNGQLMKPYLVSEIEEYGVPVKRFKPTVVKRRIASKNTVQQVQYLLETVVDSTYGTAYKLRSDRFDFAGKTGTAQINYKRSRRGRTTKEGYRASFAGYFPAKNPKYSCIVMINKPRQNGVYGGEVAGPVFREIADKVYTTMVDRHIAINEAPRPMLTTNMLPHNDIGRKEDMALLLDYFDLPYAGDPSTEMVVLRAGGDTLALERRTIREEPVVPNVTGMGLRDAIYILEGMGLRVTVDGVGKVAKQSIKPGTRARGQHIKLSLR